MKIRVCVLGAQPIDSGDFGAYLRRPSNEIKACNEYKQFVFSDVENGNLIESFSILFIVVVFGNSFIDACSFDSSL